MIGELNSNELMEKHSSEQVLHFPKFSFKYASCSKSASGLLPCSRQEADIWMCLHGLLWLDDNKSDCNLIAKLSTSLMQAVLNIKLRYFQKHKVNRICAIS